MPHAHELMRTDFIVSDINDTVTSLIGQMARHKQHEAIVFDKGKYKGVASKKWLLAARIDTKNLKLTNILKHRAKSKAPFYVPILKPETDLPEIARLLTTADIHALPVIAKNKVVGMVHARDVVNALRPYYKGVKAEELASTKIVTVDQNDKLSTAVSLMVRKGIGHIIVVNKAKKLIGVLSLTDIMLDAHIFPRSRLRLPTAASHQKGKRGAYDIGEKTKQMSLPVHNALTHVPNCCTATPNTPMSSIIDMMVGSQVASVVITNKDMPIGIVTIKDILEDFSKA